MEYESGKLILSSTKCGSSSGWVEGILNWPYDEVITML